MAYRNALWLLFLLLTAANIYIFINRKGYEYVKQSSYAELYPNTAKGISHIAVEKDTEAVIELKGYGAIKWIVSCNDSVIAKDLAMPLRFALKEKLNRYVLTASDSAVKPVIIDIDYSPASLYKASSSSIATNYEIRYCSVPFVSDDSTVINKWKDDFAYMDAMEIAEVKRITDSLEIKAVDSTANKIKKIYEYIYRSINKHMGVPADSLSNYSVYRQFCLVREGRATIWCANITDIFHLFATSAGIICRKVGVGGSINEFHSGNHSLNECYLPETGEWAYVDLTQNILLLKDSSGRYLNTVDLYHLKKQQQTNGIIQLSTGDSSIVETYYADTDKKYVWKENDLLFPYPYNPKTLYSFSNKFRRYAGVHPWLEVYSENRHYSNYHFYLKSFLFHAWLLLSLIILVLYLFTKNRKS